MNKTAMQTLIEWGDQMMLEHPMKLLSFAEVIDKAVELLEMEKKQIVKAWEYGCMTNYGNGQTYYNETYKKSEQ